MLAKSQPDKCWKGWLESPRKTSMSRTVDRAFPYGSASRGSGIILKVTGGESGAIVNVNDAPLERSKVTLGLERFILSSALGGAPIGNGMSDGNRCAAATETAWTSRRIVKPC